MKALILAAGFGTRLGVLTKEIPKPMLPIGGEPMLSFAIRHLASFGFTQIALNLHFQAELIRSAFGDGSQLGVEITYSFEKNLLGTAGALIPLKSFFENETDFLVLYGDIITNQNIQHLLDFHRKNQATATLLLHKRKNSNSVIELEASGRIKTFLERPTQSVQNSFPKAWVNSGVQVLSPQIYAFLPDKFPADLPRDVYAPQIEKTSIYGFQLTGYRCAVDSQERYAQVCRDLETGLLTFPWS